MDVLKRCFNTNNQGAGVAFSKGEWEVSWKKGFMDFDSFKDWVEAQDFWKNQKEYSLMFHFRIGTTWAVTKANTHPYVLTNSIEDINLLEGTLKTSPVVAHNWILSKYPSFEIDKKKDLTDSAMLVRNFFALPVIAPQISSTEFQVDVGRAIGYNKFCFLYPDGSFEFINKALGDEKDWIWYSNTWYKPYVRDYGWGGGGYNLQRQCGYCKIFSEDCSWNYIAKNWVCQDCARSYAEYI